MAEPATIGGSGTLFVGEDKTFKLELLQPRTDGQPHDSTSVPVDMSTWIVVFDVRKKVTSADPAIFSKTAVMQGAYNVSRTLNTLRAVVSLTDTELNTVKAKEYQHTWQRMDDGSETVLAWGPFAPEKATAP